MNGRNPVGSSALFMLFILSGLLLVLVPGTAHAAVPNTPAGIQYYVPITLINAQSSPTPAPFQALVHVNSVAYSGYEAGNLRNVEFFNADGSVVSSWLESGNSNSATDSVYWLRIDGGIPAYSSVTVYMGFASTLTNLLNNQATGMAPQLTSSYGQYDDGQSIFNYYTRFGGLSGNTLPFGWQTDNVRYVTVRDRGDFVHMTFTDTTNAGTGAHAFAVSTPASVTGYPTTLEAYMAVSSYGTSGSYEVFGDLGSPGTRTMTSSIGYGKACSGGVSGGNFYLITGSMTCIATYQSPNSNTHVFSLLIATSTSLNSALVDYSAVTGTISLVSQPNHYFGFGGGASSEGSGALDVYWVRTRSYPPNGIMPSAQFGNVVSVPVTTVSLNCMPSLVVLGSSTTCTVTVTGNSPTGTVSWTSSGSGNFSPASCSLSLGSCQTSYTPADASSPVAITAAYEGDSNNPPASGALVLGVSKAITSTKIFCSSSLVTIGTSTSCNIGVTGISPSGSISLDNGSGGTFQPFTCVLSSGECTVSFTPSLVGTVTIIATYSGDLQNQVSSGNFTFVVARASTSAGVACVPTSVAVGASTSCVASVMGGYSPTGIMVFSSSSGTGTFTPSSQCLLSFETCQVSYYDTAAGSPRITASYRGDSNNGGSTNGFTLSVTSSSGTSSSTSFASSSSTSSGTSSSSVAASSSSTTGGGGIPEFPYQVPALLIVVTAVVLSYMLVRSRSTMPKTRKPVAPR